MSAITAKASRKMKKYAVLTREPRCFLGSFDFSWEQRKLTEFVEFFSGLTYTPNDVQENGTLVLRSSNVSNGEVVDADNIYVNPQVVNSENVKVGDIVVVVRNGSRSLIGKHAQIKAFMPHTVIGAFMTGIRSECPEFTNALLNTSRFEEEIAMNMGATINQITGYMFSKMEFKVPCLDEQKKIGEYFEKLDNLITLHQRKCVFLFGFFQAFISMIFTASTFSWEQRKAIDIADYSKGNGYSKGDLTDAGTPIILYGRLYTKYQFAISEVDTFAVPRNGAVYSQGNEVIVPASGETAEDIARASAVEKSGVLLGGDLNILRPFDFINPLFLALAISNGEPQKELAKKAQGKSVVHIHNTDIQEVTIAYPSRTEQDRIVSVFRQLDHLITLHQRECISFTARAGRLILTANKKRNTSSWEQRKLGDIADIVGGGTPSTGNQSYWDGDIDWYAPAEIADQIYANSSQKKITGLGYKNSSAKMLPPGTVLFTSRAGIGKTAILTRKGCTNQGFQSIVPHRGELDSYFIFSRTGELKRYGELVGAGSTFVEVSGKQMAVMELMMPPTMREQQTIGGFFQQLDHLITLHQRKPFLMKWRTSDANRNQTNRLVL